MQDAAPSYIPCSAAVSPIGEERDELSDGLRNQTGPYEEATRPSTIASFEGRGVVAVKSRAKAGRMFMNR